jgi:hypothetical protein
MKTKILSLILSLFAIFAILSLSACGENVTTTTIDDSTAVVITAKSSIMTIDDNSTLQDYLVALKDKGEISFEGYEGTYGYYITAINGKAESLTDCTYWAVFTDFTTLDGDDTIYATDYQTVEYKGKTLYSASYGVSGIPCVEGHTYAFVFTSY